MAQYSTEADKILKMGKDPRIIRESGRAEHIATVVEPVIEEMGYQLVSVYIDENTHKRLVIMVDRHEGGLNLSDCETLTHAISPIIDIEDPIESKYFLEISSPGTNRPLVRLSDFAKNLGKRVQIEMRLAIEGRKKFRGFIEAINANNITLKLIEKRHRDLDNKKKTKEEISLSPGNHAPGNHENYEKTSIRDTDNLYIELSPDDMAKAYLVDNNVVDLFKNHRFSKKTRKKNRPSKNYNPTYGENT